MTWTDERVEQLRHLVGRKLSRGQIAVAMGIVRNSVIGKCYRLGLSAPKVVPTKPYIQPRAQTRVIRAIQPKPVRQFVLPGNRRAVHPTMPPSLPEKPAEPVPATRVTLMGLTERTCRWPCWGEGDAEKFYCGGAPVDGLPYCRAHCRKAYTAPRERA